MLLIYVLNIQGVPFRTHIQTRVVYLSVRTDDISIVVLFGLPCQERVHVSKYRGFFFTFVDLFTATGAPPAARSILI
jgi:hypothetical protein